MPESDAAPDTDVFIAGAGRQSAWTGWWLMKCTRSIVLDAQDAATLD